MNARHLRKVLAEYESHFNEYRPHRALNHASPLRALPDPVAADINVIRRDRLGGLRGEHRRPQGGRPQGDGDGAVRHNGSGKTTLINILTGALPAASGRAVIAGFDIQQQPREARRHFGLTGQFASVDGRLSGRGNLILIARLLGASRRAAREHLLRWPEPAAGHRDVAGRRAGCDLP